MFQSINVFELTYVGGRRAKAASVAGVSLVRTMPARRTESNEGMGDPSLSRLAFFCFQLVTAVLILRPAELFAELDGLPLYEGVLIACLLLTLTSIEPHFRWQALVRQPISVCIAGMFLSVILSHATHVYLGGLAESTVIVFKTMIFYALVVTIVNSPARMQAYLLNLSVCCSLMGALCLFDYWGLLDFEGITHLVDTQGHDEEFQAILIHRLRGLGIFQDPNDMAMIIVASGVLCLYQLTNSQFGVWRLAWLVPIALLIAGLLETKSRGGLLAAGCAALVLSQFWLSPKTATVFAVIGAVALPLVAGRSGEIDLEDGGTAHERMMMWREGFYALKSPDLLFGVGQGMYAEVADLVAHNSFVHAYVELGVVGGTLFFGCFYFAAMQLYRIGQLPERVWLPELERMRPYLASLLAGWCGSMFSLSRCYVVPTFLVIGLMATYANLVWIHTETCRPLALWNRAQMWRLGCASALTFVGLYVFTMIAT